MSHAQTFEAKSQTQRSKATQVAAPNIKSLWLGIRLPYLSLESLQIHAHSELPILVADKNKVCAATDVIQQSGVTLGMSVTTAHCLNAEDDADAIDDISTAAQPWRTYPREPQSEQTQLKQLCDNLYNVTPYIQLHSVRNLDELEEFGILLEVSRCLRLFKGLPAIVKHVQQILENAGHQFCMAQAHTANAAWLLTYRKQSHLLANESETQQITPVNAHDVAKQLSELPLDIIYEHKKSVSKLRKSGFFYFSDVLKQIHSAAQQTLTQRFGQAFSSYLQDTLALSNSQQDAFSQTTLFNKPKQLYQPELRFNDSIQFDYPIENCEQLQHPMQELLQRLSDHLVTQQQQTQAICWSMYDIYQNKDSLAVYLERLHRDIQLALELSMIQLEAKTLAFAVDTLELHCEHTLPVSYEQHSIAEGDAEYTPALAPSDATAEPSQSQRNALAITAAKLTARLGEQALFTLSEKDSHIPELSFSKKNFKAHQQSAKSTPAKHSDPSNASLSTDRPSWIFNTPYSIGTRQNTLYWKGRLELLQGPERIEGLWWKKPTARDYFVAQRDDDVRLWVFFDYHKDEWFVHGVFA